MENFKYCNFCKQTKEISNFTINNRNEDKRENKCKTCVKNKVKAEQYIPKENYLYCKNCKEEKEKTNFHIKHAVFSSICKDCVRNSLPILEGDTKFCIKCNLEKDFGEFTKDYTKKR